MIPTRDPNAGKVALAQLLAGRTRPHKRFMLAITRDQGRHEMEFAVRSISVEAQQAARAEALRYLTTTCGWQREDLSDTGESVLNLEVQVQVLARALVDPASPDTPMGAELAEVMDGKTAVEGWRKAASRVRTLLDVDEVQACFDQFVAFQEERSPFDRATTVAEVKEMVEALGKGQLAPTKWMRFERTTLIAIINELVARLSTRTTARSSDTSPKTSSSEDSSATSDSPTETLIPFGSET